MNEWAAVVLAAGRGMRMRSRVPKMLQPVAGKPMVLHVLDALRPLQIPCVVTVVGADSEPVAAAAGETSLVVRQDPPLGTGHALLQARDAVDPGARHLVVVNGDMPLLEPDGLRTAMEAHAAEGAAVTIVTALRPDPRGLGRVVRGPGGKPEAIVEDAEASEEERGLLETNEGIYCLDASWAWDQLSRLPRHQNGEYYLTDLVAQAVASGQATAAVHGDPLLTMGVNDKVQLAAAEAAMRRRIRERLMLSGVTIIDPPSTFIDAGVEIGRDTVVHPGCTISGNSRIGEDCEIGPMSILRESVIGDGCRIVASVIEGALVESRVEIGPYCHLRPGSHVEEAVHLGNYVEVKNSRIGRHTAVGHFSYIGDATLGERVNIGAGTVTCNYDGAAKHATVIGNDVFIGSDTMLVAPVTLGDGAATGAGSVVTHDVDPGATVVGVPARAIGRKKRAPGPDPTS